MAYGECLAKNGAIFLNYMLQKFISKERQDWRLWVRLLVCGLILFMNAALLLLYSSTVVLFEMP